MASVKMVNRDINWIWHTVPLPSPQSLTITFLGGYLSYHSPRETRFFRSATQVKPCRAGLGIGWVTHREYRREGPYFVLSFLFLFFCVSYGVIFKSAVKSIFSIISAAGCRKIKTQTRQYSSLENYYASGRSTELKFWSIGGKFKRQTNKIGFSTV